MTDSFADTKRDRRQIRHSAFVSRIAKSAPGGGAAANKRRRPNKKLVATLESLGDALGEIEVAPREDGGEQDGARGKVRHRSIASRPGALRRKEKVVRGEMERFSRSLAQLATLPGAGGKGEDGAAAATAVEAMETEAAGVAAAAPAPASSSSTSSRFAALRGFITATMEQNPAFVGKG